MGKYHVGNTFNQLSSNIAVGFDSLAATGVSLDDLLKQPGKTTLRTKEGQEAVKEAIEYLKKIEPVGALRFNAELAKVAKAHI